MRQQPGVGSEPPARSAEWASRQSPGRRERGRARAQGTEVCGNGRDNGLGPEGGVAAAEGLRQLRRLRRLEME